MFGRPTPVPTATCVTRWANDPFSFGAYSYVPVGGSGQDYEELAQPAGERVFLAGEATFRPHPATAHGAYLSAA